MSHFSVIVVTKDEPDEGTIGYQMAPFHEFECTGVDDEFVQDVDITEESRKEYLDGTTTMYVDPDGKRHDPYGDQFHREFTPEELAQQGPFGTMGSGGGDGISWTSKDWGDGLGYRGKVHFLPEGWQEIEVPRSETQTFAEFVEGWNGLKATTFYRKSDEKLKYGYCLVDYHGEVLKVIDRTNQNKKWDYWRIGGRYAGKFFVKNIQYAGAAPLSWEWKHNKEQPDTESVDWCRKCDLDQERMQRHYISMRRKTISEIMEKTELSKDDLQTALRQESEAHQRWLLLEDRPCGGEYRQWLTDSGYPLAEKISNAMFMYDLDIPDTMTIDEWINAAPWISSFAFVRERTWSEQGKMGWFACVSNENENWPEVLSKLLADVPDDHYLTVVDCHI